jgi:hypothetical protein
MDPMRFEAWLRLFATTPSRRVAARLLTMTILGVAFHNPLGPGGPVEVSATRQARARQQGSQEKHRDRLGAEKKRKRKKKKNAVTQPAVSPPPCPSCAVCETCVAGTCVRAADGTSCGPCEVCQDGVCVARQGNPLCLGGFCEDGVCVPCGGSGQGCCPSGGFLGCNDVRLACGSDNVCRPCGYEATVCCPLLSTECELPLVCCLGACFQLADC